jgi:hypothetical protein
MRVAFFSFLFICNIYVINGQIKYEQLKLIENYCSTSFFPEKNKDGYYCYNFLDGFVLASYRDSVPEGVWISYSKDSIIMSTSFFSKGEILYSQYFRNGKLYSDKIYEYPFLPKLDYTTEEDTSRKLPEIGLLGERLANNSINYRTGTWGKAVYDPKYLTKRVYKEGKVINIYDKSSK